MYCIVHARSLCRQGQPRYCAGRRHSRTAAVSISIHVSNYSLTQNQELILLSYMYLEVLKRLRISGWSG